MEPIERVFARHERDLLRLPNVTGVGVRQRDGYDVVVVFVTHKVPKSQLRPEDTIPSVIDGYRTEVQPAIQVGGVPDPEKLKGRSKQ